jgi:hypothetical protein
MFKKPRKEDTNYNIEGGHFTRGGSRIITEPNARRTRKRDIPVRPSEKDEEKTSPPTPAKKRPPQQRRVYIPPTSNPTEQLQQPVVQGGGQVVNRRKVVFGGGVVLAGLLFAGGIVAYRQEQHTDGAATDQKPHAKNTQNDSSQTTATVDQQTATPRVASNSSIYAEAFIDKEKRNGRMLKVTLAPGDTFILGIQKAKQVGWYFDSAPHRDAFVQDYLLPIEEENGYPESGTAQVIAIRNDTDKVVYAAYAAKAVTPEAPLKDVFHSTVGPNEVDAYIRTYQNLFGVLVTSTPRTVSQVGLTNYSLSPDAQ